MHWLWVIVWRDSINVGSMFITDCILYVWASPHLPCAEQDWFGMMTFLRLIGRWAKQSVSDPIPEGVSFHSAYMHRDTQSGYHSPSPQACSPMWAEGQNHLGWSSGLRLHLLFLLQSCDPELVYMCSPETQTAELLCETEAGTCCHSFSLWGVLTLCSH